MKKTVLLILLVFPLLLSANKDQYIDSLWGIWNDTTQADTNRLNALNKLIYKRYLLSDPDSAFYFAQLGFEIAKAKNLKKHIADALNIQGVSFKTKKNDSLAILYYKKSLKIRQDVGDTMSIAKSLNNIGIFYADKGDDILAFKYLMKSIKVFESLDYKNREAFYGYLKIGQIYFKQEKHEKALNYFLKNLELVEKLSNKRGQAIGNYTLGVYYMKIKKFEKSLFYLQKSLPFYLEIDDKIGLSQSYNSLGNCYQFLGDFDLSYKNHQKSLKIKEALGKKTPIAVSYLNLGFLCLELNEVKKSIAYGEQSLSLVDNFTNIFLKKEIYDLLYKSYKKAGQTGNALYMHELYLELTDSLNKLNKSNALTEQELKYEFDKKAELEKTKHNAELKQQKLYLYSGVSGLILMLLIAILLYRNNNIRKKSNAVLISKNELINIQKEEIEKKQAKILESINYAIRIQSSIMLTEEEIKDHLPELFIFYRPKDIVSGDFYWFYKKGDLIFIATVDCTGHGIPGAFMSMIGNTLLNEIVEEKKIYDPGNILNELHAGVIYNLKQEKNSKNSQDGMDISLCSIDLKKRTLKFAGAKNSLYVIKDNALEKIKANYFSIGGIGMFSERVKNKINFETKTLKLVKDTHLYLFSDGYADQFHWKDRSLFGDKQFKKLLIEIHKKGPDEQKKLLAESIDAWKGSSPQIDDILVIGIKV